ncbi:zinc dependent phospholipase C family protein [Lewinella sp. IMCC34191]|uniref:zinc dependent phospholipase C family protein n=1 Tax=Lewinella sp. IMCC34191 TaxID=2259172 RepID=UPI000E229586|nr:zinc dependent phospholipase C family protein [Lewinella sp. IMCC34191]
MIRSSGGRICFTIALLIAGAVLASAYQPEWGFFGHRRINRLATFTLPTEMMPFFRGQIDYLSEHAVDPDKRRYAANGEAIRHYMDLDHYGASPFDDLPRNYAAARMQYGSVLDITAGGDTIAWVLDTVLVEDDIVLIRSADHTIDLPLRPYQSLWYGNIEEDRTDSLRQLGVPLRGDRFEFYEAFSDHGILPYHLISYHRQLTNAFVREDANRILQLAAEMGHYVGDAHVPLHTTENYNGQLTGQTGIHAFWESRLPELFADEEYDYFVGPAEYIDDPQTYYWEIVLESHSLVDSVLRTERRLSEQFAADQQLCFEERLGRQVQMQCTEYARAWSEAMAGMVEDRFRAAIHSVGSVWYSCWVDAGQPDLSMLGRTEAPLADTLTTRTEVHALRPHE